MNSRITKIFIDSRYSRDGTTFDLHDAGIVINPDSRMWLSEFTCPASWDTIDSSNDSLVVVDGSPLVERVVTIPRGAHDLESLRESLEVALNSTSFGTYTVNLVSTGDSGSTHRSYVIENTLDFSILNDDSGSSMNSIVNFPGASVANTSHKSSFIDIRRTHSIYVNSPGFGSYSSYGVRGGRSIIAKIPILVGYAGLVHYQGTASEHDCVRVGVHSISSITLELQDAAGLTLDLNDAAWSATLIFEN